jgi:metal-responsive CopG/Arc/MetJ family transcriptional regulator
VIGVVRDQWRIYTAGMEIAVTIPNEMFQQAEELAATLGISRSELYTSALAEFIRDHHDRFVTERLNRVYAENDSELDPALQRLQTASISAESW